MPAAQAAENRHMRLDLIFRKRDITSISTWIKLKIASAALEAPRLKMTKTIPICARKVISSATKSQWKL